MEIRTGVRLFRVVLLSSMSIALVTVLPSLSFAQVCYEASIGHCLKRRDGPSGRGKARLSSWPAGFFTWTTQVTPPATK
jgi:hypothetical protein